MFVVPALGYAYNALEPFVSAETMFRHHAILHEGYVSRLNAFVEEHPDMARQLGSSLVNMVQESKNLEPEFRDVVRNNAGGHINHTIWWKTLCAPSDTCRYPAKLEAAIGKEEVLKQRIHAEAKKRFGSGWVWVVRGRDRWNVTSTPNQDSPYMREQYPLFGIDLWEHSYYDEYGPCRENYIDAVWNCLNWRSIESRFNKAARKR